MHDVIINQARELIQKNKYEQSNQLLGTLLEEDPTQGEVNHLLGIIYLQTNQATQAQHHLERALETLPLSTNVLNDLGIAYLRLNRLEEAKSCWMQALVLSESYATPYSNLLDLLIRSNELVFATFLVEKALNKTTKKDLFICYRGDIHFYSKKYEEAYENYTSIVSTLPIVNQRLGLCCKKLKRTDEAIMYLKKAVEYYPDDGDSYENLGLIYYNRNQSGLARNAFLKALQIAPSAPLYANLATMHDYLGGPEDGLALYRQSFALDNNNPITFQSYIHSLLYLDTFDPSFIYQEHRRFQEKLSNRNTKWAYTIRKEQCLRIGFVSGDFGIHCLTFFLLGFFRNKESLNLKIHCYHNNTIEDEHTKEIELLVDRWMNIDSLTDDEAYKVIQQDSIDILIDLSGHTAKNRLSLFALKPAPIQASYLGYPHSTGMDAIDFFISDLIMSPPEQQPQFIEKLIYIDTCSLNYTPDLQTPPVAPPPYEHNGYITFGCFNNLKKITPQMLQLWSQCLSSHNNSILIFKYFNSDCSTLQNSIIHHFKENGITSSRIRFLPPTPSYYEHMDCYKHIDISLDTFPYNGATTTCESLWMGVPLVTLFGASLRSRVSGSILTCLNLNNFIASSQEDYVQITCSLPASLTYYRHSLRSLMETSPLMDSQRFAFSFERCLNTMKQLFEDTHAEREHNSKA